MQKLIKLLIKLGENTPLCIFLDFTGAKFQLQYLNIFRDNLDFAISLHTGTTYDILE